MKKLVVLLFKIVLFVFALKLIVAGQKNISWLSLGQMLLGLTLLIFLLHRYNQQFR